MNAKKTVIARFYETKSWQSYFPCIKTRLLRSARKDVNLLTFNFISMIPSLSETFPKYDIIEKNRFDKEFNEIFKSGLFGEIINLSMDKCNFDKSDKNKYLSIYNKIVSESFIYKNEELSSFKDLFKNESFLKSLEEMFMLIYKEKFKALYQKYGFKPKEMPRKNTIFKNFINHVLDSRLPNHNAHLLQKKANASTDRIMKNIGFRK